MYMRKLVFILSIAAAYASKQQGLLFKSTLQCLLGSASCKCYCLLCLQLHDAVTCDTVYSGLHSATRKRYCPVCLPEWQFVTSPQHLHSPCPRARTIKIWQRACWLAVTVRCSAQAAALCPAAAVGGQEAKILCCPKSTSYCQALAAEAFKQLAGVLSCRRVKLLELS